MKQKRSDSTRNTHQMKVFLEYYSEDETNQAKLLVRGLHIYVSILGGFVASLATSEEEIPSLCSLLKRNTFCDWLRFRK